MIAPARRDTAKQEESLEDLEIEDELMMEGEIMDLTYTKYSGHTNPAYAPLRVLDTKGVVSFHPKGKRYRPARRTPSLPPVG